MITVALGDLSIWNTIDTIELPVYNYKRSSMKENIHLKISASDKQELAEKARELGLSLSAYIRLRLKEASLPREVTLREIVSH